MASPQHIKSCRCISCITDRIGCITDGTIMSAPPSPSPPPPQSFSHRLVHVNTSLFSPKRVRFAATLESYTNPFTMSSTMPQEHHNNERERLRRYTARALVPIVLVACMLMCFIAEDINEIRHGLRQNVVRSSVTYWAEPQPSATGQVLSASDASILDSIENSARAIAAREHDKRQLTLQRLKRSERIWYRGKKAQEHDHRMMTNVVEDDTIADDTTLRKKWTPHNSICGRSVNHPLLEYEQTCPSFTQDKPILLMDGEWNFRYGRTGNLLIRWLHAIQMAREQGLQLGVMNDSWAMQMITPMWFGISGDQARWQIKFERAFCIKVFYSKDELNGWDVLHREMDEIYAYKSEMKLEKYMASQMNILRTLLSNYNTGVETDYRGVQADNLCSGIQSLFGENGKSLDATIYTVIHSRHLEGKSGTRRLGRLARLTGCDPKAALELTPDYIKAILKPLGMMHYPIVFISDGQNRRLLSKLMADEELGPLIREVPKEESSLGSDMMLGIMSNVFIGNPASTFSTFIAKSRLALGFGHNELFRRKKGDGEWGTVCGDNCIFDYKIQGSQA